MSCLAELCVICERAADSRSLCVHCACEKQTSTCLECKAPQTGGPVATQRQCRRRYLLLAERRHPCVVADAALRALCRSADPNFNPSPARRCRPAAGVVFVASLARSFTVSSWCPALCGLSQHGVWRRRASRN